MAGVRVGLTHDGEYLVNPTTEELEDSQMDLIVAGTESAVLMIEGYCDFLTEEQVLEVSCWPKKPTQQLRGESLISAPWLWGHHDAVVHAWDGAGLSMVERGCYFMMHRSGSWMWGLQESRGVAGWCFALWRPLL